MWRLSDTGTGVRRLLEPSRQPECSTRPRPCEPTSSPSVSDNPHAKPNFEAVCPRVVLQVCTHLQLAGYDTSARETASRSTRCNPPIFAASRYSQWMLTLASRLDVMNRLGRAMADPTRSSILLELLTAPGYTARLAESLGLTRTNVSNHRACLRGCGIVVATPEGRQTRYEIADSQISRAIGELIEVVIAVDDGIDCSPSQEESSVCCGPEAIRP